MMKIQLTAGVARLRVPSTDIGYTQAGIAATC